MEISSKIHLEQLAPPDVHRQRSDMRDRQTKITQTFLAAPAAGEIPSPTKLGMVIEDIEHVLAPPKLFVRRIVSPLRGAENLSETGHHQLKTPITP